MRKGFLIAILSLISFWGQSQIFPSEIWHDGKLVLVEGDTLRGQVKYDLETDIIQFSQDRRTIKTFTARKLLFFEIFDTTVKRYRQFYAIPYNLQGNYKTPIMFEVLFTGDNMSLMSREAVEYQVTNNSYGVAGTYSRLVLVYSYFFLNSDGTISSYSGKKRDLLDIMSKKSSQIKKYIKSENLRVDRQGDLVRLTAYYNSLFSE